MQTLSSAPTPPAASADTVEVTMKNFMDVVQSSLQQPVLLYFTASWCGPCKQFGPTLEKVVKSARGKLKLARVDIDQNKQIAAQFGVQSVPTVFVLFQGQPIDAFQGAVPEGELKKHLAKLGIDLGDESLEEFLKEAEALLQQGEAEQAMQIFREVNAKSPENTRAIAGVIKGLTAQAQFEEAEKLLVSLPDKMRGDEAITSARAALQLAQQATKGLAGVGQLIEKLERDPNDHQSRYDLAVQYFASGKQEEAIDELLTLFARDRGWNDDAARKQLVAFFDVLGHTHPLTLKGRRRLSSLIFA